MIWPSNSPDYNPFDYYVWSAFEWETNKTPYNSKDELKAKTIGAFTNLNKETGGKACRRFQSCLHALTAMVISFDEFDLYFKKI